MKKLIITFITILYILHCNIAHALTVDELLTLRSLVGDGYSKRSFYRDLGHLLKKETNKRHLLYLERILLYSVLDNSVVVEDKIDQVIKNLERE